MSFIPIPNCAKVTLQWLVGGQVVEVTLSFTIVGGWDAASLGDLNADVKDWYDGVYKGNLPSTVVLTNINSTDQSSASAPSIDLPITSGGAGTTSGSLVPLNATAAVKFLTDSRGRSYRGRNYWPGIRDNQLASPLFLSNVATAAIVAAYAALTSYLTRTLAVHVVASRFTGGAPRSTGVTTPVTAYGMDSSVDSQRRRLAGRGI